jgi:hypothetical protein
MLSTSRIESELSSALFVILLLLLFSGDLMSSLNGGLLLLEGGLSFFGGDSLSLMAIVSSFGEAIKYICYFFKK